MKIYLLSIVLLFLSNFSIYAQTFGNEWISYDQPHYKFKVVSEGIHRIDYQTLVDAGISPVSFSSSNMQIFGKEKEQPLLIIDGGDDSFDLGDYFLFYADRIDGWLDSTLYVEADKIGNPAYNMFNDTILYFFTWNNQTNNLRFSNVNPQTNYNDFTPSPFCIVKSEYFLNYYYNDSKNSRALPLAQFTAGEGYASNIMDGGGTTAGSNSGFYFNTPNLYTGSGATPALFHGKSNSNSNATSNFDNNHHLKWTIGGASPLTLVDTIFKGYKQIITNKTVPLAFLSSGSTITNFQIVNDLGALTDYQSFSYMSLTYPRTLSLNGANKDKFWIRNSTFETMIRLDVTSSGASSPRVFILGSNPKIISTSANGAGSFQALIPNSSSGQNQQVYIEDESLTKTITLLEKVTTSGYFTDFNDLTLFQYDSSDIIIFHPKLDSASTNYKNYRLSPAGGSYNVVYANIEELYLQFGGGIVKHNAAIRRFAHFAYKKATIKPMALTILGKGYSTDVSRRYPSVFQNSLIPAFGHPGSDIAYTAFLEGSNFAPLIPTGRISVNSNQSLQNYLQKLIDYENQQNQGSIYNSEQKDWQKQILHFSGGSSAPEQAQFLNYMNVFKSAIENAYFAGNVTTYRKISSDPLDPSLLGKLSEQLENGISLMTFFGHSSASGFDLNIDDPSNWNNTGKYPIVIGNGCYAGDIYNNETSFGEKFLDVPNEGAIAFVASVSSEYDNIVFKYCAELYNQMSPKNYGLPLSHQIKKTIEHLQTENEQYIIEYLESTFGATNLNGDPLLKINWHTKPEIEITQQSLSFSPENINLTVDSIDVQLIIKNLGKSVVDTFLVEIKRDFPNSSSDSIYQFKYPYLNYVDTLQLKLPTQAQISVGINNFSVSIDIPSFIEEQYEEITNNQINKLLFIKIDALVPVYPYEFAVVPDDKITLKASTINPIGQMRTYRFEVDTTDLFDSPIKRHATFSGLGGIKEVAYNEWLNNSNISSDLILQDSVVYFWRTAIDSAELVWTESSFQYIKGKEGWGQDHFFQFKNNEFDIISYDRPNRKRKFGPVNKSLRIDVYDHASNINETAYFIDNQFQDYGMCWLDPSLHLVVIDPITLKSWFTEYNSSSDINEGHYLNNINHQGACRPRQEKYFIYRQDSLGLNNLNNAILNQIPNGFYYAVYAVNYANYPNWGQYCPSLFQTLSNAGSSQILPSNPNNCFIFFTKKGFPNLTEEIIATVDGEKINITTTLESVDYEGVEKSPLIGPSTEWKTLYWKQDPSEATLGDTTLLKIELFNNQGALISHIDTNFTRRDSILDLGNLINAANYPFIRLSAHYKDKFTFTPAQNDRWHVLYSPVPEAAIDGSNGYTWLPDLDTLKEGQEYKFAVDVKNISNIHMDSLLVRYWIEDHVGAIHPIPYLRQDSLRVTDIMRDTIKFSTVGIPGNNSFWMEINPYINGSLVITDQLEQYHFNNLLQVSFYVIEDDVNPILDVTFNGRHILNGDIIDPESEIVITLKDDNEFLIMNDISDTTLFGVYLTSPDGIERRIPFTNANGESIMQWYPAESQFKKFKIVYPAAFAKDGVYFLTVQGADRSGNISGDIQYRINFEVIHESSITYLMNYPNPFSTSTRFVFTLTGSEIPDDIIIQIMTVTGKVVREITEDQIGPIYIGRNISEYAWDGTDEFGDRLANGVYLYRVLSRINGEAIKHRDTDADGYFKKDFGKMYIIR
jgi:hypothetical protein